MANIPVYLQTLKSSGIYRFVIDKSQISDTTPNVLRLFVGSSKKGPFNTPVLIRDRSEFIEIFGNIDTKLERYGSFFHRSCLEGLRAGPILALNLKLLDDTLDNVDKISMSALSADANTAVSQVPVTGIYSTDKFWEIDYDAITGDNLLNFTTVGNENVTIVVRKSTVKGYDVTAAEWYGSSKMPEYINPKDLISDYMVDVFLFGADLTDSASLATNVNIGKYFSANGILKSVVNAFGVTEDSLEALQTKTETSPLGKYTGCLIPGFTDKFGNVIDISAVFNQNFQTHQTVCTLNTTLFDEWTTGRLVDLIGYSVAASTPATAFEFLSYNIGTVPTGTVSGAYDATPTNPVVPDSLINPKSPTKITISDVVQISTTTFQMDNVYALKVGDYMFGTGNTLVRVVNIKETAAPTLLKPVSEIEVTCDGPLLYPTATSVIRFIEVEEQPEEYQAIYLEGYDDRDLMYPDGTAAQQADILNLLTVGGLREALIDQNNIQWRYLVDTYVGYVEAECKGQLASLAKSRETAFAILNPPTIDKFKKSTNPYFKKTASDRFDPRYIESGGNLSLPATTSFSLPVEGDSFCAFYTPELKISENGKIVNFPPAATISNLYARKLLFGQPYEIVAGVNRGIITSPGMQGLTYAYNREELDAIEPFGLNAIVSISGYGFTINSNQTAQQKIKSALSNIHVREIVIYIQEELYAILEKYRWEFNNPQVRSDIKTRADALINRLVNAGALISGLNKIDETNNTPDMIASNIGLIETTINPAGALGIIGQTTIIDRQGNVSFNVTT